MTEKNIFFLISSIAKIVDILISDCQKITEGRPDFLHDYDGHARCKGVVDWFGQNAI
jgi:hypothetical protein